MRVYNSGTLVSRSLNLPSAHNRGSHAVEDLIASIREVSEGLEYPWIEVESEEYNYGDSVAHYLVVYGTPTGELAEQAVMQWKKEWGKR